jgi:hypothetical protein
MYSNLRLLDSINRPEALIKTSKELGLSGLAITDHEALCAHMTVNKLAKAMRETDPDFTIALGNEIYLTETREPKQKYYHFILIAKDNDGYTQLKKLSSLAWTNIYEYGRLERVPTLKEDLKRIIKENPGHVIATSACFLPGVKVQTKDGYKNIENITSNDIVLTHTGEWQKVNFPTSRDYNDTGYTFSFNKGWIDDKITCTKNHQFLVYDKKTKNVQWKEAAQLKTKDYCMYPLEKVVYNKKNVLNINDFEEIIEYRKNSIGQNYSVNIFRLPNEIKITNELMRLFGLWLGDGSVSLQKSKNQRITFSFSEKEFKIYYDSFVKQGFLDLGLTEDDINIKYRPKNHKYEIDIGKREIVIFFQSLFGENHAETKCIPQRLLHISKELDVNLWFGYMLADGYFRLRSDSGECIAASVSRQLINDMYNLSRSLNLYGGCSISKEKIDKHNTHHRQSYYINISSKVIGTINKLKPYSTDELISILEQVELNKRPQDKNTIIKNGVIYQLRKIKNIKKIHINEKVYCLNVDNHSFVCENVIVHNCIGGELSSNALLMAKARAVGDNQNAKIYYDNINNFLNYCLDIFGSDFYIECAPSTDEEQILVNQTLYKISKALGIPIVIGTDAHYLRPEDRPIHRAYLTSKEGDRETDKFYQYTYVMSPDEVKELMLKSIEDEAVIDWMFENSQELQKKIQWFSLERKQIIPKIQVKEYDKSKYHHYFGVNNDYADELKGRWKIIQDLGTSDNPQERYWINQCLKGLIEKGLWEWNYIDRICVEADIIQDIGKKLDDCLFAYFNTFQHYINLFWECGSIVGPGRGSATGFLSNYLLGITQLDPIRWDLPYWRFLNKERAELPGLMLILGSCKKRMLTICLMGVHFMWANGISEISLFRTNQLTKRAYVL